MYTLAPHDALQATQLPLVLSRVAPDATIETTVAHLDDAGMVWRTLAVRGPEAQVRACAAAFAEYAPRHLVEKEVLADAAGRLVLWYKYRPETRSGASHTALAFRLLGRDAVITDRTRGGLLTVRMLCRPGAGLQEFVRRVRATPDAHVQLLYSGPPREAAVARLTEREQEALRVALRMGYYREPRGLGVRELAAELSMSASAVAYRLRRAEAKLVEAHLQEIGGGSGTRRRGT